MYDAANVWTYGVDGSVGAEARGVDPQVGGALLDHFPYDIELHLGKRGLDTESTDASSISVLEMEPQKPTRAQTGQAFWNPPNSITSTALLSILT